MDITDGAPAAAVGSALEREVPQGGHGWGSDGWLAGLDEARRLLVISLTAGVRVGLLDQEAGSSEALADLLLRSRDLVVDLDDEAVDTALVLVGSVFEGTPAELVLVASRLSAQGR